MGEDTELVDVFESLETAVEEGHRELAAALVTNTGASSKKGMKKSDSEVNIYVSCRTDATAVVLVFSTAKRTK